LFLAEDTYLTVFPLHDTLVTLTTCELPLRFEHVTETISSTGSEPLTRLHSAFRAVA